MSQPSDADLMVRVQSGDRDAFGQLVDRHKDALVGYLCRLTGAKERAEDVAQEAFVRLYEFAPRYRENGQLSALLFRIATNLVRSDQRKASRWRQLLSTEDLERPNHSSPQSELLNRELHAQLSQAIAQLPMKYRVPLVLHDIEGWTYARIAEFTNGREGTVKSRISRARARLRDRLAPLREGADGAKNERQEKTSQRIRGAV